MLDAPLRRVYMPAATRAARALERAGIAPGAVTLAGLLVGLAAATAVALGHPYFALGLWIANRILDGLDGPLARLRGPTDLGGYVDFAADLLVYASLAAAIGYANGEAQLAILVMVGAFYVNLGAHLALSALLEKRHAAGAREGRSLLLVPGLAEGFETVLAYALMLAVPVWTKPVAWTFAVLVAVSALQRVLLATRALRDSERARAVVPSPGDDAS